MILLNHQHLYYFWVVAREGTVTGACRKLYLSQSTISGQIIQLEKFLGKKLFERRKKRLVLTEDGRQVLDYANIIFNTTREMLRSLEHPAQRKDLEFHLGIDAQVSKMMVVRLLQVLARYRPDCNVIVREAPLPTLLNQLQMHNLDLVFSDQAATLIEAKDYLSVEVGRLDIFFAAAPNLAATVKKFPSDLSRIPLLLPTSNNPLRSAIQQYLNEHNIQAHVFAELEDAGLMRLLAIAGLGAAPLHSVSMADDVKYGRLKRLGQTSIGVKKSYWLVAKTRRHHNPLTQHLLKNFRIKPGRL